MNGVYVHRDFGLFIDLDMLPAKVGAGMRKIVWTTSGYRDFRWPDFFDPKVVKKASPEDSEMMRKAFILYKEEIYA